MKPNIIILAFIISILIPFMSFSQVHDEYDHKHMTCNHQHKKSEIGIGLLASLLSDGDISPALHTHYLYSVTDRFSTGLGYEILFGDHKHQTISVVAGYRFSTHLIFSVAPGITFETEEGETSTIERKPSIHLETVYEFDINGVHIGPLLEYAWDADEWHISLGLHVGLGW